MSSNTVLPENICLVLNEVVKLVNCNPRDMKRVINLLQIIFVLGNIKPRGGPIAFSKDKGLEWSSFLEKCVLWIVLCQNFPYRMSLLVQVLLDFDQKQSFNAKSVILLTGIRVVYRNNTAEKSQPKLDEEMSIYEFYMTYVDKFVKAFKKSDRFCRLDNDPEEFTALLQLTAHKTTIIKCADVLGPREKSKGIDEKTNKPELTTASESAVSNVAAFTGNNSIATSIQPSDFVESGGGNVYSDAESKPFDVAQPMVDATQGVPSYAKDPAASTIDVTQVDSSTKDTVPDAKEAATESEGKEDESPRDSTFSLLSYSFNLDPAMRIEVSILSTISVDIMILQVYCLLDWGGDRLCCV